MEGNQQESNKQTVTKSDAVRSAIRELGPDASNRQILSHVNKKYPDLIVDGQSFSTLCYILRKEFSEKEVLVKK